MYMSMSISTSLCTPIYPHVPPLNTVVELQWLDHLWDHENLFVRGRGNSSHRVLIIAQGQEPNGNDLELSFRS